MESDLYDCRSVHQLIRHKGTGTFVAHIRLIFPDPNNPEAKFPMENYCKTIHYEDLPGKLSRTSLAEVSRFLISKEREQQIISASATQGTGSESTYKKSDGPNGFLLLYGLITAGLRTAMEKNNIYLYACIDIPLFRLLRKFRIHFLQIGPQIEYYGKRFPCFGSTESILSEIYKHRLDLWYLVTKGGELTPHKKTGILSGLNGST